MPVELQVVLGLTGLFNPLFFVYPDPVRGQLAARRCSDNAA